MDFWHLKWGEQKHLDFKSLWNKWAKSLYLICNSVVKWTGGGASKTSFSWPFYQLVTASLVSVRNGNFQNAASRSPDNSVTISSTGLTVESVITVVSNDGRFNWRHKLSKTSHNIVNRWHWQDGDGRRRNMIVYFLSYRSFWMNQLGRTFLFKKVATVKPDTSNKWLAGWIITAMVINDVRHHQRQRFWDESAITFVSKIKVLLQWQKPRLKTFLPLSNNI